MKENQLTLHAPLAASFDEIPQPRQPIRRGAFCPKCTEGILDYNGLLELECPHCGYTEGSGAGCT
jgi:hypothetical protein